MSNPIRIGTAEPDSTFLTQGRTLAEVLAERGAPGPFEVLLSPAASIDNANRLARSEIDLGFMAANWIGRARRGEKPFTAPIELRMVAPMNAGPLFFVAHAGSGIRTFDDLAGKRVSVGPSGSGMAQHAQTMLAALGRSMDWLQPAYLSFADGARALAAGEIDAQLQCPIPNLVMTQLDVAVPLEIVRFGEAQLDVLLGKVDFYRRAIMPRGALRALQADAPQPGVLNVLVCHARAEPGRIEAITRAIIAGAADLGRRNPLFESLPGLLSDARTEPHALLQPGGVGLHQGARSAWMAAGAAPR